MEEKIRLSKLMTERKICSRREAEFYIDKGYVVVDGKIVNTQGVKVSKDACIELVNEAKILQRSKITLILNKPVGIVSTQPEKGYEAAISLITKENRFVYKDTSIRFSKNHLKKLSPIGRLDIDSKGLLLFSQDGTLAKKIIGNDSKIEKEYLVRFDGNLTEEKLSLLSFGLKLDGRKLKRAKVTKFDKNLLKIVLIEGKKRQIRRMFDLLELKVLSLKRVRIGNIRLANLPISKWRYLSPKEVSSLKNI